MDTEVLIFEKEGFPIIKIYNDHFKIKAIDYWEYRTFYFTKIKDIKYYDPNNNWWSKLFMITSLAAQIFSEDEPWTLKILLKNEGDWTYKTSPKRNPEFNDIIKFLKLKLKEKN